MAEIYETLDRNGSVRLPLYAKYVNGPHVLLTEPAASLVSTGALVITRRTSEWIEVKRPASKR